MFGIAIIIVALGIGATDLHNSGYRLGSLKNIIIAQIPEYHPYYSRRLALIVCMALARYIIGPGLWGILPIFVWFLTVVHIRSRMALGKSPLDFSK